MIGKMDALNGPARANAGAVVATWIGGHDVAQSTAALDDRFWSKVDKSGSCWVWTGGSSRPGGYGSVYQRWDQAHRRPVMASAHRLSYADAYGPIPEGMDVCHRCDNPPCVRPSHLFVGTARDNGRDMARKGRAGYWSRPGDANPAARLTWDAVRVMRARHAAGETITALGSAFGVHRTTASLVVRGRTWKEPT